MTQRLPASVMISLAFHAGFLVLFLGFVKQGPKSAARIVSGVELLIAPARPKAVKPPPISTMDFLKMALPAVPRRVVLQAVDVKLPENRKPVLAEAPKLEDDARKNLAPKLEALDLARARVMAAKTLEGPQSRRRAAQTLAALPRLEEVGRKRVKNLPEALVLEEKRREATALIGGALDAPRPTSRRAALAAATVLTEAEAPDARADASKSFLPEPIELRPRSEAVMAPKLEKIDAAPKLERRQAAAATDAPKKGVEIEGPLADRKVISSQVPTFPDWARTQGLMEADVAIRFTVDAEGNVMAGMRVERTSGYGRLDRLVMESLRRWTFAPAPGTGAQWGVITFRFLLE